jgi:hypothetical protein
MILQSLLRGIFMKDELLYEIKLYVGNENIFDEIKRRIKANELKDV